MAVRLVEVVLLEGSVIEITIDVPRLNQIAAVPDVAFCVLIPEIGLVMGAIAFVVCRPFGLLFGFVLFEDSFCEVLPCTSPYGFPPVTKALFLARFSILLPNRLSVLV
ncbi:hypothetical protein [Gynuella sunshinyii]|uniref:hypothetical protein n=1 Tax=Gynuella sunshinyii TaxID=1445505 RepID=UPI0009E52910|nr:hypothetical protein [Gynuella sunshinyii]